MVIRYIGLREYNDINKNIDINLGGPFTFKFCQEGRKWPYITLVDKNDEYIYELYKRFSIEDENEEKEKIIKTYEGVSDISAIVGQNSAGKTSVLKMISNTLREIKTEKKSSDQTVLKYVMIQEDITSKELYVSTNIHNFNQKQTLEELSKTEKKVYFLNPEKMVEAKQQLYFSGIFDKSSPLYEAYNLTDISTNTILNKYITSDTKEGIQKEKSIADFRQKEIVKRVGLLNKYPEVEEAFMFDFPDEIKMFFDEDISAKDEIYSEYENEEVTVFKNIINGYMNESKLLNEVFPVFLIEEYVLSSLVNTDFNFNEIIVRLEEKIDLKYHNADLFKSYFEKLNIPIIAGKTEKTAIVQDTDEDDQTKAVLQQTIDKIEEFNDSIAEFDSEFDFDFDLFTDLVDDLRNSNLKGSEVVCDAIENIITPIDWGEVDICDYGIENFKNDILKITKNYLKSLDEYYADYVGHDEETSDSTYKSFENQDEIELGVENQYKAYEQIDTKIRNISEIYRLFIGMFEKGYARNLDAENIVISLHEKGSRKSNKRKEFLDLCKMIFSDFKKNEYPNDLTTFLVVLDHDDICSGYNGYFDMLARISDVSEEINKSKKSDIVIMIDEGELFLHPQAQKDFIKYFLMTIPVFFVNKDVQLIMATNSPFILSDIQRTNILCLAGLDTDKGLAIYDKDELGKTFGTNITTLLIKSFFMNEGVVGAFARTKINGIIGRLNSDKYSDNSDCDAKIIDIIGDDLVRNKLKKMYFERGAYSYHEIEKEIKKHEEIINSLREQLKVKK